MRVGAFARLIGLGCLGAGCQLIAGDFEVVPAQPPLAELPRACLPDSGRCTGAVLERCAPDRKTFQAVEECASPDECDPTARACHPCVPGDYACNGQLLALCDPTQVWQAQGDCLTPELCSITNNRGTGQCIAPVCEIGQHACSGNRLLRCASGRDRYELLEVCADAAHCDASQANAAFAAGNPAHCVPLCSDCTGECTPGSIRCGSLPEVQQCTADGVWVRREVCDSRALCNAREGRCMPPACSEEQQALDRRCTGQNIEQCSTLHTAFEYVETCPADQLCDPGGCTATPCEEGRSRCNDRTLERCEGGQWEPRNVCKTRELCSEVEGVCNEPECEPGSYRCDGIWVDNCENSGRWGDPHDFNCGDSEQVCIEFADPSHDPRQCLDI